jgi:hypothetical protein
MPTVNSTVRAATAIRLQLVWEFVTNILQVFHAYAYGTAFWYGLRGACRVWDPQMVVGCTLHAHVAFPHSYIELTGLKGSDLPRS